MEIVGFFLIVVFFMVPIFLFLCGFSFDKRNQNNGDSQEEIKTKNDLSREAYRMKTVKIKNNIFKIMKENMDFLSQEYQNCWKMDVEEKWILDEKKWKSKLNSFSNKFLGNYIFDYDKFNEIFIGVLDFNSIKEDMIKDKKIFQEQYDKCIENNSLDENMWQERFMNLIHSINYYNNYNYDYEFFNSCLLEVLNNGGNVIATSDKEKLSVEDVLKKYIDTLFVPYRVDNTHLKRVLNLIKNEKDKENLLVLSKDEFDAIFNQVVMILMKEYSETQINSLKEIIKNSMNGLSSNFEKCFSTDEYHIKKFDGNKWKEYVQYFQDNVLDEDYSQFIITKIFLDIYLGDN